MLVFSNPGTIDVSCITTFGLNVKEGSSPIGQFGTGLKYAIAGILRLKGQIFINTEFCNYGFFLSTKTVRGKTFDFVNMVTTELGKPQKEETLGFTTHLGSHWEPWMLYRELYCNCIDERGEVFREVPPYSEGFTHVIVELDKLDFVHFERNKWFLDPKIPALYSDNCVQILPGSSDKIFYRGIAVHQLEKPSLRTYNIICEQVLSEDRTLSDPWRASVLISNAIGNCSDQFLVETLVFSDPENYENHLPYGQSYSSSTPSETFISVVKSAKGPISKNALSWVKPIIEKETHFVDAHLIQEENQKFLLCVSIARSAGFSIQEIAVSDRLEEENRISNKKIWLGRKFLRFSIEKIAKEIISLANEVENHGLSSSLEEKLVSLSMQLMITRSKG